MLVLVTDGDVRLCMSQSLQGINCIVCFVTQVFFRVARLFSPSVPEAPSLQPRPSSPAGFLYYDAYLRSINELIHHQCCHYFFPIPITNDADAGLITLS
jgi:hypothetical protein